MTVGPPLGDRVVLRLVEREERTKSGIVRIFTLVDLIPMFLALAIRALLGSGIVLGRGFAQDLLLGSGLAASVHNAPAAAGSLAVGVWKLMGGILACSTSCWSVVVCSTDDRFATGLFKRDRQLGQEPRRGIPLMRPGSGRRNPPWRDELGHAPAPGRPLRDHLQPARTLRDGHVLRAGRQLSAAACRAFRALTPRPDERQARKGPPHQIPNSWLSRRPARVAPARLGRPASKRYRVQGRGWRSMLGLRVGRGHGPLRVWVVTDGESAIASVRPHTRPDQAPPKRGAAFTPLVLTPNLPGRHRPPLGRGPAALPC